MREYDKREITALNITYPPIRSINHKIIDLGERNSRGMAVQKDMADAVINHLGRR